MPVQPDHVAVNDVTPEVVQSGAQATAPWGAPRLSSAQQLQLVLLWQRCCAPSGKTSVGCTLHTAGRVSAAHSTLL